MSYRRRQSANVFIIAPLAMIGCNAPAQLESQQEQPIASVASQLLLLGVTDCNSNGAPDSNDISNGDASDCNQNGVPDLCDLETTVDQWASQVLNFSSQFGSSGWSAQQVLGEPDVFSYGDVPRAWAPRPRNGSLEFVTVSFDQPVYADAVTVRETFGNGMVTRIEVIDLDDNPHVFWQGVDPSQPGQPVDFRVDAPRTSFLVRAVMVHTDTNTNPATWEEIDAIALHGVPAAMGDCDKNGVPDGCQMDADSNGIADICEMAPDCNSNGVDDAIDLATGASSDCNANATPDECDVASGVSEDCNADDQPDECDPDCNSNGASDACDIVDGFSEDCDQDGLPDECAGDADNDGFIDGCDVCPDSDSTPTLIINDCDTGVANAFTSLDGCTLADDVASCAEQASNHGQFVVCIIGLSKLWEQDGLIDTIGRFRMRRCAAGLPVKPPSGGFGDPQQSNADPVRRLNN